MLNFGTVIIEFTILFKYFGDIFWKAENCVCMKVALQISLVDNFAQFFAWNEKKKERITYMGKMPEK